VLDRTGLVLSPVPGKSRAHEREERKEGRAMAENEDVVVSYGGSRGGFAIDDHVEYFKSMLQELPSPYEAQDTNRLVLAYLAVSALDLLNALHQASFFFFFFFFFHFLLCYSYRSFVFKDQVFFYLGHTLTLGGLDSEP
jgi:hypothetical protein